MTQRGNYRQKTFFDDGDRYLYLDLVSRIAKDSGLSLLGWCLMPNHVHWIVIPYALDALAQTFRRAHSRYAVHVNQKHQRASGHLWQNRYYSCLLGDNHLWNALRYVELNPVRGCLVSSADEFEWSSASVHTGRRKPPAWIDTRLWRNRFSPEEWSVILKAEEPEDWVELRKATRIGLPWATSEFVQRMEIAKGVRLTGRPPGRPRSADYLGTA